MENEWTGVAGTTKRLLLQTLTLEQPAPMTDVLITDGLVGAGEYVRYAILDKAGAQVASGSLAHTVNGTWQAVVTLPAMPGRYEVVWTAKVEGANDEWVEHLQVVRRRVPLA